MSLVELHAASNLQLKELLLQYNITNADIEGTGKNGTVLKSDRIKVIMGLNPILIFDFETYKHEHNLMKPYFKDLELMLRTALFIDYKHNHLPPDQNTIFETQIEQKPKKQRKTYITTVLDAFEPRYLFTAWFQMFAPDKLERPNFVEDSMDKYKYHPAGMFNRMYKARFDSKWDDLTPLWFS